MWKEAWLGACRKRSGIDVISRMRRMIRNTDTSTMRSWSRRIRILGGFHHSTGKVCPKAVFLNVHDSGAGGAGDVSLGCRTSLNRLGDRSTCNRIVGFSSSILVLTPQGGTGVRNNEVINFISKRRIERLKPPTGESVAISFAHSSLSS